MIEKVYVDDCQDMKQYSLQENHELDYSITPDNQLRCENRVILYGLCVHLFKCIKTEHYRQIQNYHLHVGDQRQTAIYFMNRGTCKYLQWANQQYEVNKFIHFFRNQLKIYDVKIVLQFLPDIEFSTHPLQSKGFFFVIYFYSEDTQAKINDFHMEKMNIPNQIFKNKLKYLDVTQEGDRNIVNVHGLGSSQKINYYFESVPQKSFKIQISDLSVQQEKSEIQVSKTRQEQSDEVLVMYGEKQAVQKFVCRLNYQISSIRVKQIEKGNETFNNFLFATIRAMHEKYNRCKMVQDPNKDKIQVYYHQSIEEIFNEQIMKLNKYRTIKITQPIKAALKNNNLTYFKNQCPDLMTYESKDEGDMLISTNQIIQYVQSVANQKIKQRKAEKQQKYKNGGKMNQNTVYQTQQKNYFTQFFNNVEIKQSNYQELIKICRVVKVQQHMTFKIDIGNFIRISNRVKKCSKIYLIFQSYVELVQLQTIIEDEIPLKELGRVIEQYKNQWSHKPTTIKSSNGDLLINLYPATQDMWKDKQKYFRDLLNTLREDNQLVFNTIVCSLHTLKQFLNTVHIDLNVYFIINQRIPCLECDDLFNKQTQQLRNQTGRSLSNYLCVVKSEVQNKDFKNQQNVQKQQKVLTQIMSKNIHQYEIGDGKYILNEVDEYNIAFMIAEGIQKIFITLSVNPTAEYVYMTYFQKLYKVIRDKNGNFSQLRQATFSKEFNRDTQLAIRPILQRAFLTGQKYLAISLPFQHIKLTSLKDINRLENGNHHLVRYYTRKFMDSERFKMIIRQPCTAEYVQKQFAKQYKIKFDNRELRKQIKALNLGYGNIKKERENKFVCMEADYFICQKLVRKFELQYENRMKEKK